MPGCKCRLKFADNREAVSTADLQVLELQHQELILCLEWNIFVDSVSFFTDLACCRIPVRAARMQTKVVTFGRVAAKSQRHNRQDTFAAFSKLMLGAWTNRHELGQVSGNLFDCLRSCVLGLL